MFATMPIILVGSLAVSLNLTAPIDRIEAKSPVGDKSDEVEDTTVNDAGVESADDSVSEGEITTAAAPTTYQVVSGDTVSGIAGRYGLSTASVLALNGLGWKSTIFPGQVLKLVNGAVAATPIAATPVASTTPAAGGRYTIVSGDTISGIAGRYGVTTQAILTANGLGWSSIIYPGQSLAIPGVTAVAPAAAPVAAPVVAAPVVSAPVVSAPVVAAPVAATPVAPGSSTVHTIVSGDTLSGIASKYGVTVDSILSANSISLSTTIYAGATLTIKGTTVATSSSGEAITLLTDEMEANARTIVSVGRQLGVSDYGLVVALAAAMQESSLRNIDYGDRDSVGLFQQRPSQGWGTVAQLTDPTYSARLFFGGASNPNKGITAGLLDISGWESLTVTQAAQRVQISAYPDAYAKWEKSARFWLSDLG
nr:LysM peptidoglycan-binding domain-containing protein [Conyzicola lurida]